MQLAEKYRWYLANTTEESREYDEEFRDLEHAYCAELLENERREMCAIFGDTDDWDEDDIPPDHDHELNPY